MSEEFLTYKSSGVDVDINNEANERIKAHVKRTHNRSVLTEPGLFGGGVSLTDFKGLKQPVLAGALGFQSGNYRAESAVREIIRDCNRKLQPEAERIAFLDYIAAAKLDPARVEAIVGRFADLLSGSLKIPIIGGETAEMPGSFHKTAWEVVGALYGIAEAGDCEAGGQAFADISIIKACTEPALVLSMDGVGTKTRLGIMARRTQGLALDIVHHSLNDILCQGARGIALMVYVGCHSREEELTKPFFRALSECGRKEGLACLDLAVSEKPLLYLPGEYDICAAVAGLVDEDHLIKGSGIKAGDRLIGLPSSGLHTNGYSLARKALLERGGFRLEQYLDELGAPLGEVLLLPHKNYVPAVFPLLQDEQSFRSIRGIAHITGGGLKDNLARILPAGLGAKIQKSSWQPPPIFALLQKCGNIPEQDPAGRGMFETFNMGIGMVIIADSLKAASLMERLRLSGEEPLFIGEVIDLPEADILARERVLIKT